MSLCMGCMQELNGSTVCPHCHFDNSEVQPSPFLPLGTELAGRYLTGVGLDTNGESTRYIAYEKQTGNVVIVTEFLPIGLFSRDEGQTELKVNYDDRLTFNKLRDEFVSYFRIVSDLKDLSALTNIVDIFQENNTVYVVEEKEDLIPFEEYIERSNGRLDWDIARPLFMPVISALEALHKRGIGHYAVAPKNLFITTSGKIRMSGYATENERKRGTALKSQLFSGAAAPEQYEENFPLDDITDIYGLCSTLFYALTGHLPKSALERLKDSRLLMSTSTVKSLPPHVVSALANGLQVQRENRITDFDELRSQLSVAHTAKAIQDEISRTASMNITKEQARQKNGMSHASIVIISVAVTVLVLGIAGVFWLMQNPLAGVFSGNNDATAASTSSTEWTGPVVPNYVGMKYEDVVKAAAADDTVVVYRDYNDAYSDKYAEGVVMQQYPPAGSKVDQEDGITVSVTVSLGAQMRELPAIQGNKIDEAAQSLADAGLLATAEYQYSDTVAENRVIGYKNHVAGDTLESGSNIIIIVSKGRQQTTTQATS
ncbi:MULTISPECIES: PASTA domain-containing protein [Eubacteriales]|jgi:serine/threonine protein kinase|uniref:PASTA domain-containing protein n=1 Tax=Eubacteriales TaxID=186802 RepID=UPI000E440669|nr:PASTA domain-containing protein [Eubacterium sp. OM08-24]RGM21585.1 PASTA domain-containing protein [Eubacterium sp. OM08-24]